MNRRDFLRTGAVGAIAGGMTYLAGHQPRQQANGVPPAASVVPVVGDGQWIWNKPPEGETGYLEPRSYKLDVGIELNSSHGNAWQVTATTPVPIACPEQKIEEERIQTFGCQAQIQQLAADSRQLCLVAPQIPQGQKVSAVAHYKLTLFKQFQNYRREQFPNEQSPSNDIRRTYLGESPGIQTRSKEVKQLLAELSKNAPHPWDLAQKTTAWIRRNIRPQIGSYTGVVTALETRRGDCEEMAAIFVAVCRAAGIPARLVWIPNHNWAEFHLTDKDGKGHWIPAHTACYFWFGWTGAHELVLQKGDRIRVADRHKTMRLVDDWLQYGGRKPEARYIGDLTPLPPDSGGDAGPGARQKIPGGEWKLVGTHALDRYARR
jgi:hypothetical protein